MLKETIKTKIVNSLDEIIDNLQDNHIYYLEEVEPELGSQSTGTQIMLENVDGEDKLFIHITEITHWSEGRPVNEYELYEVNDFMDLRFNSFLNKELPEIELRSIE